ncbi:hypothetical protein HOLDEFILI_01223 [Holdemania filiformis DSM 12042]|uniref:Uncharacterized protein n=1 Tax=Holdemania filiformis DSM 12042 TaxID=545696 RepID=B9Y5Z1_9FIRM|nr:hypothetical protein HOLDEFILI_01223 [Holdemania filiformis DSM 12042]
MSYSEELISQASDKSFKNRLTRRFFLFVLIFRIFSIPDLFIPWLPLL